MKYAKQVTPRGMKLAVLMMTVSLTACAPRVALEKTVDEVFTQLDQTLPTASLKDTSQTRREVAIHRAVFKAICPKSACADDIKR